MNPNSQEKAPQLNSIQICMGSSCFSRGNNRNIEVLQSYMDSASWPAGLELSGHLCEGACRQGPNVTMNGKMYHEVDPIVIIGLLNHFGANTLQGAPASQARATGEARSEPSERSQ